MRLEPAYAVVFLAMIACSGEPNSGLDGEWTTGDPDSGKIVNPVDGGDAGAKANDSGVVVADTGAPVDAAKPVVDSGGTLDAGSTCINGVAPPNSGHHHPGADCMSCHDGLSANLRWTVAGTVYAAANSTTAVSGANVEVIDSANKKVLLATSTNGNFYTTQAFTFPVKVRATKCPADSKMNATATTGSCNSNSCHTTGMRIHVP